MFDETVHIVPFGYEYDRTLDPIKKSNSDTVVLLNNSSEKMMRVPKVFRY